MRFLTYNVHSWTGTEKIKDYRRALDVVCELKPDAAALQEVVIPAAADNLDEAHKFIEEHTGMHAIFGQTMLKADSPYGNVLLTKLSPEKYILHDISVKDFEPRGMIYAELETKNGLIALLATHLGLKRRERIIQAEMIKKIADSINMPFILMCDCNEWYRGKASVIMDECISKAHRKRSFPSGLPLFALDAIRAKGLDISIQTVRKTHFKRVSDHLPVIAEANQP